MRARRTWEEDSSLESLLNQMRDIRFSTFSLLVFWPALAIPVLVAAQDNSSQNDAPTVLSHGIAR